ncbi:MAP7 domain-containing protein 2-like [Panicum virgatum]|uniref:MAP7 domain-containing protein 2-like n=1 Tax=Panicum virgatum TaxID=38727 RepID=UPI0019D53CC2|nr:MAP7 domain-containing protein 2-like [Panicum virgatum]
MQDPPRDEGAVNAQVGALDVPAIKAVRTVEVPAIEAEKAQAEPLEGIRPSLARGKPKENESLGSHMVECAKLTHEWVEALVDMSEQAAQELARGSAALGRVAELEAKVAELEVRSRRLEADKVKAEDALRKEKRELEACTKANEELQKLREAAEAREASTEEKLRLEREARKKRGRKWRRAGRRWIA